jgi:hypothetical protein
MPAKRWRKKYSGAARKAEKDEQTPCIVSVHGLMWYSLYRKEEEEKPKVSIAVRLQLVIIR